MLGRFLEISLRTHAIQQSLAFYESLGFVQATVHEAWPHPYAVVTDGRLFIGLHDAPLAAPVLSFVLPGLAEGIVRLENLGIDFDERRLGDMAFNQATFRDPNGQVVSLLEARTFSPPQIEAPIDTRCGYFSEFGLPTRMPEATCSFWEPLGFVALDEEPQPFPRISLMSERLNIALYRSRMFHQPLLTFEDEDMRGRLQRLRKQGLSILDDLPHALDQDANGILIAPEGTRLLLLQSPHGQSHG